MFTDNTKHKINKSNPAEMDRNGSKVHRVPLRFPIIAYRKAYFVCLDLHLDYEFFFTVPSQQIVWTKSLNKQGGKNGPGPLT